MRYSQNLSVLTRLSLALFLTASTAPVWAGGNWDKCPQSVSITPEPDAPNRSGISRSVLKRLAPAVLVTGVTYDFGAVCPVPTDPIQERDMRAGMRSTPVDARFYQEHASADDAKKQIVLLPFQTPQRSIIITPTRAGSRGRFVPVKFTEAALGSSHEQKIVVSVSIGNEKALATFVLISAGFYHQELEKLGHRRHARHHRRRSSTRRAEQTRSRS